MNSSQISVRVLNGTHTLVFISKNFGDRKPLGTYIKDQEGNLERVHGNSAESARKFLLGVSDVVRSYGAVTLTKTQGTRTTKRKVFMTEYSMFGELVKEVVDSAAA